MKTVKKKNRTNQSTANPIAIIGMACKFPKAGNLNSYWENIRNGVDAITEVPQTHWNIEDYFDKDPKTPDHTYASRGGFLDPIDFNPLEFGITPNAIEATDTSQLISLVVARQALEDAGYGGNREFNRDKVSVIMGVTGTQELVIPLGARLGHPNWRRALHEAGVNKTVTEDVIRRISDSYVDWQENSFPGLLGNVVAGRIANRLDFGGTNCVVDAACASSLSALHLAAMELDTGRTDMVVTGGIDTFNSIFMYMCFSKTPVLSQTGNAKPFDHKGDGTVLGEGLGILILKRLDDAERDNDKIYAVIRGIGSSSDGKGNAIYMPSRQGQSKALRQAYDLAGVSPNTVELVEAHGTGTKVGDATEVNALIDVYGSTQGKGPWCALGSVKSQIGHTKAAAGVAGIIKTAMALNNKVLPPTIKVEHPIKEIDSEKSPFYVNTKKRPWMPSDTHPRRAAVSALGFGGSNFHCVLEEYKGEKEFIEWDPSIEILGFSANNINNLKEALKVWPVNLSNDEFAIRAANSREAFSTKHPFRLTITVEIGRTDIQSIIKEAREMLEKNRDKRSWSTLNGIYFGSGEKPGKLGVLFPGQGSQYVGMLRDLACRFPQMQKVLTDGNRIFSEHKKQPFQSLTDYIYPLSTFDKDAHEINEGRLRATQIAQPAIGAVSVGIFNILCYLGLGPDTVAGHSYGELTALCAANRIDQKALHRISGIRGKLMAENIGIPGAMIAVRASLKFIEQIIRERALDLVVANKNTPNQSVLSGSDAEIEKAATIFSKLRLSYKKLPVSAAFHSKLVAVAREPFLQALNTVTFVASKVAVFANSTAEKYPKDEDETRKILAGQLASPVEFVQQIENMYNTGVKTFLEVGPGNKLSGLVKDILAEREHEVFSVDASSGKRSGAYDLSLTLARLSVLGYAVKLAKWNEGIKVSLTSKIREKSGMVIPLTGANYVKPGKSNNADRKTVTNDSSSLPSQSQTEESLTKTSHPENLQPIQRPENEMEQSSTPRTQQANRDGFSIAKAIEATQQNMIALQKMQEQTASLHRQFLENQEKTQNTLHSLVEQQQQMFQTATGVTPLAAAPIAAAAVQQPEIPIRTQQPAIYKQPETPSLAQQTSEPETIPAPREIPVQAEEKSETASNIIENVLLEVVSEKTGYPVESLELDMGLDSDLGIDSIKQVEILSTIQEKLPNAPEVKPDRMGQLVTLRQLMEFLAQGEDSSSDTISNGEPGAEGKPAAKEQLSNEQATHTNGPDSTLIEETLLEVVAEKTGYPVEMLELDMGLDSDLGIDSIKQVEILSTLQEKLPEAPEVKPEHMGQLRTLRQLTAYLSEARTETIQPPLPSPSTHDESETLADPEIKIPETETDKRETQTENQVERSVLCRHELNGDQDQKDLPIGEGSEIWITDDGSELAKALENRLRELKYRPKLISLSSYQDLSQPADLGGLLILTPEKSPGNEFLKEAFKILRLTGSGLRKSATNGGAVFATVSRLDGAFGLNGNTPEYDPLSGGLAGLPKTAQREWNNVRCKAIDISPDLSDPKHAASSIVAEMFRDGPVEVGISRSSRCTLRLDSQSLTIDNTEIPLTNDDTVIITGGARGVTAEVAITLAGKFQPTLVLLGRSPKPTPEPAWLTGLTDEGAIKKAILSNSDKKLTPRVIGEKYKNIATNRDILRNIADIETAGSKVYYYSIDIRDEQKLKSIIDEIHEKSGPVRGLIHGAGVLADKLIEDKSDEQFEMVYSTKVSGLNTLLKHLKRDDLKIMALFSSFTGRYGRVGQVDYAVANEVLNKIAQYQARMLPKCRVVSVNWGPWDGGMVTPSLKKIFEKEGVGLIPLKAGADCLIREISAKPDKQHAEVILLGGRQPDPDEANEPSKTNHLKASSGALSSMPLTPVFERDIDIDNYPFLRSHIINGRPVLPMAMITEWMAHGALHLNPGLKFIGFNNLRIFKGVKLSPEQSCKTQILTGKTVKQDLGFTVPVELRSISHDGKSLLHANGDFILSAKTPKPGQKTEEESLSPYPVAIDDIYREFLFHGPDLQGIIEVEGVSDRGIAAKVKSAPSPSSWIRHPLRSAWLSDPLVLDCAFQLMILWSFEEKKAGSLPCFAGQYRQYKNTFPGEGVRILAHVTKAGERSALADIDFVTKEDELIASIKGYECTIDPALRSSFRNNKLTNHAFETASV